MVVQGGAVPGPVLVDGGALAVPELDCGAVDADVVAGDVDALAAGTDDRVADGSCRRSGGGADEPQDDHGAGGGQCGDDPPLGSSFVAHGSLPVQEGTRPGRGRADTSAAAPGDTAHETREPSLFDGVHDPHKRKATNIYTSAHPAVNGTAPMCGMCG